jgi:hypothetical protein
LNASEEAEALVDLYDPEGPLFVDGKSNLTSFHSKFISGG